MLFCFKSNDEFLMVYLYQREKVRSIDRLNYSVLMYKVHQCNLQNCDLPIQIDSRQLISSIFLLIQHISLRFIVEFEHNLLEVCLKNRFHNDPMHERENVVINYEMCGCNSWHFLQIHAIEQDEVFLSDNL